MSSSSPISQTSITPCFGAVSIDCHKVASNVIGEKVVGVQDHYPVLLVPPMGDNWNELFASVLFGLSKPIIKVASLSSFNLKVNPWDRGDDVRAI